MLDGLFVGRDVGPDLLGESEGQGLQRQMVVLDDINRRHGRDTLRVASMGLSRTWLMPAEHRSPRYTTCLGSCQC